MLKPGSQLSKEFAQVNNIGDHSISDGLTHDDYKAIYTEWHQKIGSAAIGCLKSPEYMHTRAALIVLSRIVNVYPTQPKVGERILQSLASLQSDDNPRPDIRATAQGYCSQLMKARDEGMWKEENRAVTKARQEREKKKSEERRKKAAQQHEEMKKESEMISREIGDSSWRRGGREDRRPWSADTRTHPRVSRVHFFLKQIEVIVVLQWGCRHFRNIGTAPQCQCSHIYTSQWGRGERIELSPPTKRCA